ncbi:CBS domain-containing protein [Methylobacterium currus]|uniref:CBS domain-containing protein n=1 Tax=Methylobacterium currus TaxID=2051553 RepID=A0A2R4WPA5_9HYPH|nr:CBS domain-containing protein [Methylobacterium currus]AWB23404.1 CBS domain-containing protein [Methylobacterium currus]UHC16954.1 CBS domain-containing protein [Methylobacterium currus]
MLARDIMHRDLVTVTPETPLGTIARLLVEKRFGAVPVTDETGRLVGLVSEADLLHREELGTERRRNRWLDAFASIETLANAYRSAHGQLARDVMATSLVTAAPDAPLIEIVELMERRHIRRVPIVEAGPDGNERLVGMVTRGDLVRALATLVPATLDRATDRALTDRRIRDLLLAEIARQPWTDKAEGNVTVLDGVVHLWGTVANEAESRALVTMAEGIPGVVAVRDHTFVAYWGADPVML